MRPLPPLFLALALAAGCATLAEKAHPQLTIAEDATPDFKKVDAVSASGLVPYKYGKGALKAEWIACKGKAAKGTVLAMHSDRAGFDKQTFCAGWIAQAFLAQGFDVLTVNRPGYGGSTGEPDFAGAASMAAIAAAVPAAAKAAALPRPVTGAWGYDSGAAAAGLAAKKLGGLSFLIVGGGIYDYDAALKTSGDDYLKADIAAIKKTGGDKAIEDRSLSYDVQGLPKDIAIYHGALDKAVPPSQAKDFADALSTSGKYRVNLQIIEGLGHVIPWAQHRRLVEALAATVGQ